MERWSDRLIRKQKMDRKGDKTEEQKREVAKELLVYFFSVAYISNDRRIMTVYRVVINSHKHN
jgi:hypothetical protein